MSNKTAFEKIIEDHLKKTLPDGRLILRLDWVWGHEITTPNAILDMKARGINSVFNPNRIKLMIDHVNPPKDTASAIQAKIIRDFAREMDIEFLEVGRNGVCHAVIPEKGWIAPGQIGIMGDSHTSTHGAFGAFTAGVGTTDLENALITGLWICPPQKVIRVNFIGELPKNVFAKDLALTLIKKIGVKGATNAVLEFGGPIISGLSMEGRMTISNMAIEAGASSGLMPIDEKTIDYLWLSLKKKYGSKKAALDELSKWNSDEGAEYEKTVEISASELTPVITDNYSPEDVHPVKKLAGKKIDQVYIGSCTNGRISDLRIAAGVFKTFGSSPLLRGRLGGGSVHKNARCIVVPASQHIYSRAMREGLIDIFLKAGCLVSAPTCGACLGMSNGVIAPGETCVSTTNRNFPGRMGKGGMVHLASPLTAALTAIEGKISEPGIELGKKTEAFILALPESKEPPQALTGWKEKTVPLPDFKNLLKTISAGKEKNFSGEVFYLPIKNVDTDQIIPARYLTETDKTELGKHCLEDAGLTDEDRKKIYQSRILVADENFGCGSSREHAPWALEAAGIRCIIAPSFARIFYNNMWNNGLLCVELKPEEIKELFHNKPARLDIDWNDDRIRTEAKKEYKFKLSEYQKELIQNNGSVGAMLKLAVKIFPPPYQGGG
ncbi:MAG: 3-isopropylmalate dehydratase small subunit [Patescibacteria group bacterium]|jgi:3-isopropylmalate/(R)-2-methylmalate dehydratase large subunit